MAVGRSIDGGRVDQRLASTGETRTLVDSKGLLRPKRTEDVRRRCKGSSEGEATAEDKKLTAGTAARGSLVV